MSRSNDPLVAVGTKTRDISYRQWSSQLELAAGELDGTKVEDGRIVLDAPGRARTWADPHGDGTSFTYDVGTWVSPLVDPGFAYTELVASWNAHTPPGTWLELSVAGTADDGTWSRLYILGRWAAGQETMHRSSVPDQADAVASVSIDILSTRERRRLTTWQLTVSLLRRRGTAASPSVALVGAFASALPDAAGTRRPGASPVDGGAGIELDVPAYSQEIHRGQDPQYNGGGEAWCSPASMAMVLAFWQRERSAAYGPRPADHAHIDHADPWVNYAAAETFDWSYHACGNWSFNTAYAGRYGLESFVTRLRSLTEAERFIEAGIPLVASVTFSADELTGAGYGTAGHLLVICGFTPDGDVIVNDPASHLAPSNAEVRTVYDRGEFENIWLPPSGGIVYVTRPSDVPLPERTPQANW